MIGFADLVDHLVAYSGRDNTRATSDFCRRAAQQAVTILPTRHPWNWYRTALTFTLDADYGTGTIAVNASTREVTLTSGTWPTWAAYGVLCVGGLAYEVASRTSSTVIVLSSNSSPASNVASGTSYTLKRYGYLLPANFSSVRSVMAQPSGTALRQAVNNQPPQQWVADASGLQFGIAQDPRTNGRQVLYVGRAVDRTGLVQVLYQRTILPLRYEQWDDGVVAVAGTAVTGTNTKFRSDMAGMVFRAAADDSANPTNLYGLNPYVHESLIDSVASAESLTLATAIGTALTRSRAVVTSLLDVAEGPMWEYLLREAERQFRITARMVPYNAEETAALREAFTFAREDDNKYNGLSMVDYPYMVPIGIISSNTVT